jgi:hypothetical protein
LPPGYSKYTAFCTEAGFNDSDDLDNPIIAKPAQTVRNDKTSDDDESSIKSGNDKNGITNKGLDEQYCQPIGKYFNLNGPKQSSKNGPTVVQDEEDRQPNNLAAEMLRYHHRFGHISFQRLVEMAKQGVIPRRLAKCPIPACSACLYAKASKRPWRSQTSNNMDESTRPNNPGDCVSVDQLVSPTPGLIAQMTGFRTTKRYRYATVYIDQVSRLSFTYLQKTATAEETLEGKQAFEKYSEQHSIPPSIRLQKTKMTPFGK